MRDSLSFFREFVILQDEPAIITVQPANETIQAKEKSVPASYPSISIPAKSIFESHLLKTEGAAPIVKPLTGGIFELSIVLSVFFFAAIVKHAFGKRLIMITRAFAGFRFMNQLVREGNIFNERITLPLFVIFLFNTSLIIWLGVSFLEIDIFSAFSTPTLFGIIVGTVLLFYFFQILATRILGVVTKSQSMASHISILILLFNMVAGVLLLPLVPFMFYQSRLLMLSVAMGLISVIYIWRFVRIIHLSVSDAKFSRFRLFLFLYLCCVEFIPALLAFKLFLII